MKTTEAAHKDAFYRLLCPNDAAGIIIGKGGETINAIRHEGGVNVQVDDYVHSCGERVVRIYSGANDAPDYLTSRHTLDIVMSKMQESKPEDDKPAEDAKESGIQKVRMLLWDAQAGSLIGKGGQTISNIRKTTGSDIRILPKWETPICGFVVTDVVCQIIGKPESVKGALDEVHKVLASNPVNATSPERPVIRVPINAAGMRKHAHEVTFKLLVKADKIGALIGRGGTIVQRIREETGAKIQVPQTGEDSKESRIVTISSSDNPASSVCAAQEALVRCCYSINAEAASRASSLKLLIPAKQIGPMLGKGGATIKTIRQETSAQIKLVTPDENAENAENGSMTISGSTAAVAAAAHKITTKLQDFQSYGASTKSEAAGPHTIKTIIITKEQAGQLIGKGGANIKLVRKISEATVKLHDPDPKGEQRLEISGSEERVHVAEELVKNVIAELS